MAYDADYWINTLRLIRHPEGGYYRESYRSKEGIRKDNLPTRFGGDRSYSTQIYFLLLGNEISKLHKIQSDECWHFYAGDALTIHMIEQDGTYKTMRLGNDPEMGARFQQVVPAETWFAAEVDNPESYSLVGCSVAPGFDYEDFQLAQKNNLCARFPQHDALIRRLCGPDETL